jgi:hypothetical protein
MPLEKSDQPIFVRDKSLDNFWGWTSVVVPGLDWEKRLQRRLIAQEVCDMLKWPTISADRELGNIYKRHESYLQWKQGISTNIETQPDLSLLS